MAAGDAADKERAEKLDKIADLLEEQLNVLRQPVKLPVNVQPQRPGAAALKDGG